jgi:hypothetical protein
VKTSNLEATLWLSHAIPGLFLVAVRKGIPRRTVQFIVGYPNDRSVNPKVSGLAA